MACNGYEVEGEDGCLVCAFHSAVEGVEFAVVLQACMTETPWSAELLTHPACAPVLSTDGKEVLCGPRLKIGLCTADAVHVHSSARTGRMEYFGWVMNHAARVAALANG
jgi:class 3 adenylate cyclase